MGNGTSQPLRSRHTALGPSARPPRRVAEVMAWLRNELPEYRADVTSEAKARGFQRRTLKEAIRRLGVMTEYVPGDRRPWLALPVRRLAIRCRFCRSAFMVGPDCDPTTEDDRP